jgi:hypothetical protein
MMTEEIARGIMGKNLLGVSEAASAFAQPGRKAYGELLDLKKFFSDMPFSQKQLERARESHCLVAVAPRSMNWIYSRAPQLFRSSNQGWLAWQKSHLAKGSGVAAWWLVRKDSEPGSLGKLWGEQRQLAEERDLRIPTPRVMVYAIVVNFLANGTRLFERTSVRCSGRDGGIRWSVGHFDGDGITMIGHVQDGYTATLGLASAEKPNARISR